MIISLSNQCACIADATDNGTRGVFYNFGFLFFVKPQPKSLGNGGARSQHLNSFGCKCPTYHLKDEVVWLVGFLLVNFIKKSTVARGHDF